MPNDLRQHLSNCERFSLGAAMDLHCLRYSQGSSHREELLAKIMHSLLIVAEEARQGLAAKEKNDAE